jgi:hypothetical protein
MSTTNTATPVALDEKILSSIVANGGDLGKLSQDQKLAYYSDFCNRLGLDPLSQPFNILRLNGKEVLYCGRAGVQQLSKLHKVSHKITARDQVNGCYAVTAQASTPDARSTESIGVMPVENLKGDALANAMMKAESKAKRRATLDLLGLGMLDESAGEALPESAVEIPAAAVPAKQAAPPAEEKIDPVAAAPVAPKPAPQPKEEVNAPAAPAEAPAGKPDSTEIASKLEAYKTTITGFVRLDELNDFLVNLREQPAELRESIKEHFAQKVEELNAAYNPTAKIYVDKGLPAEELKQREEKWFQERIGKLVFMSHADPKQFNGGFKIEDAKYAEGCFKSYQNEQGFLFSDWVPTPAKS